MHPSKDAETEFRHSHRKRSPHSSLSPHIPLSSLSMTVCSPFSKEMASAGLWNVRPNFRSSTRQWWKMGFTLLYTRPLCTAHSSTGCRHKRCQGEFKRRCKAAWSQSLWVHVVGGERRGSGPEMARTQRTHSLLDLAAVLRI